MFLWLYSLKSLIAIEGLIVLNDDRRLVGIDLVSLVLKKVPPIWSSSKAQKA